MPRPALSLSIELNAILDVLAGLRLLAQLHAELHLTRRQALRASRAADATIAMLAWRLRALDRAARGAGDPRELLTRENRAHFEDPGSSRLPVWGTKRAIEHHRREAERLERRLISAKERRTRASSEGEGSPAVPARSPSRKGHPARRRARPPA